MHKALIVLAVVASAGCSRGAALPVPEAGGSPVVVELFQSQGCSSCPPANANVNALASRPDVLALSYAVTYWDHLGWRDTFAKLAYTERQRAYARRGQSDGVYTPQVVINGAKALVGTNRGSLAAAVRKAGSAGGPAITYKGGEVAIGPGARAPADVLIVTYDPRERSVPVNAGENSGRTLPHRNIVTDLHPAGVWQGQAMTISLTRPKDPALRQAVLLQRGAGGPIVGAAKL